MASRKLLTAVAVLLVITGCVTDPSHDMIEEFVSMEQARIAGESIGEDRASRKKWQDRTERIKKIVGKDFVTYIHDMRGTRGLAMVENVEVYVDGADIGEKVKLRIRKSPSGAGLGDILERLGSARVAAQGEEAEEGQIYSLEIIGRTPAGDYYGLIDKTKAYVLGARKVGEKVRAKVMGLDTLDGREDVVYLKII